MGPCLEITKDGETLRIWRDEFPDDPRQNADYLGTMACYHRRYELGDPITMEPDKLVKLVKSGTVIALPLYLYMQPVYVRLSSASYAFMDHSGLWMDTSSARFAAVDSYGWDWGQVGYIYVTRQKVREDFCVKRISPQLRDLVERMLQAEVREYNDYLQGDVYGYTVEDDEGRTLDSCWGFIGRPEDSGILDYIPEKFREEVADA